MIIIDIDSIKNNKAKKLVCAMVSSKLAPVRLDKGKTILEPTEAIVWYSQKKIKIDQLADKGFPKIGEVFYGGDLIKFMGKMLKEINKVSQQSGMGEFKKFHSTQVISDKDSETIKQMGATLFPISFFCGGH